MPGRASLARAALAGGALYSPPACSRGHDASFEVTWFRSSRDGRLAVVGGGAQFGITAGFLNVLCLRGYRTHMVLVGVGFLLRRGTRFDATLAAVVADVIYETFVTLVL